MTHATHSYSAALADEIEKQIEEAAEMGEPPSFALRRDQADWLVRFLKNAAPQGQVVEGAASPAQPAVAALEAILAVPHIQGFIPASLVASAKAALLRPSGPNERESIIEECAKVCEARAGWWRAKIAEGSEADGYEAGELEQAAYFIRALKRPTATEGGK